MMGSGSVFDETQKLETHQEKMFFGKKIFTTFLSVNLSNQNIHFNQLLYINVELQEVYIFISHLADVHGYMFLSTTC